ncbi:hypothetical protein Bca52824_006455 [Brassica carinata]|uniref:Uncharacterized protein n=1 Tax=Brassica carinata TaxID=52824 RepID=A0A8X8B773_BRACI|nr:hypothetical protein Bca52824_006455 [Brassica carinata]
MARPIIHFVFALIIASYLLLISEVLPRAVPEIGEGMCPCPGDRDPDCHCLPPAEDYQVLTTTPAISPPIELTTRCNRNSDCNGKQQSKGQTIDKQKCYFTNSW